MNFMISADRCKEILGNGITSQEAERIREALYVVVESVLENYLAELDTSAICNKPSFIAEFPQLNKAQKDMD